MGVVYLLISSWQWGGVLVKLPTKLLTFPPLTAINFAIFYLLSGEILREKFLLASVSRHFIGHTINCIPNRSKSSNSCRNCFIVIVNDEIFGHYVFRLRHRSWWCLCRPSHYRFHRCYLNFGLWRTSSDIACLPRCCLQFDFPLSEAFLGAGCSSDLFTD